MTDYPAKRLKVGALQASMWSNGDHELYRVERWSGCKWDWLTPTQAHDCGHPELAPDFPYFATKRDADRALQASGLPWRK